MNAELPLHLAGFASVLLVFGLPALHLCLAVGIYADARGVSVEQSTLFLWPSGWAFTALIFGLFGAISYWLMHRSSLADLGLRTRVEQLELQLRKIDEPTTDADLPEWNPPPEGRP